MQMTSSLKPWGNSMGIRIPKKILEMTSFTADDTLNITVDNDVIIIKKAFVHKSFEERLAEYDGKISAAEFDWGEPMGKELI